MDKVISVKLINCVKKYPELYNTQHQEYKNVARKGYLWEVIAKEIGESNDVLRTKWKGLKDGYMKYKKWILYRHASVKSFQNWCWASHLQFLDPYIHPRIGRIESTQGGVTFQSEVSLDNSLVDNLSHSPVEIEGVLEREDPKDEGMLKCEPNSAPESPCSPRPQSSASIQDPMNGIRDQIEPLETHNHTELLNFMKAKRLKGIDDIDLLFMSYADTFKVSYISKFSVETQAKLKVKLASLFAVAELQEHNIPYTTLS